MECLYSPKCLYVQLKNNYRKKNLSESIVLFWYLVVAFHVSRGLKLH